MKIRMGDQSLRMRLSPEEAQALKKEAFISTRLQLNHIDSFEIELRTWHLSIGEVHAEKNKLIASIPIEAAGHLLDIQGYTFRSEQLVGMKNALILEVEIDLEKAKHS